MCQDNVYIYIDKYYTLCIISIIDIYRKQGVMMIGQSVHQDWEQSLLALAQEAGEIYTHGARIFSPEVQILRRAYEQCRQITAQNSRSFYLATTLLPPEKRQAVRALYAFCRLADDLIDKSYDQPGLALQRLREGMHRPRLLDNDPSGEILLAWEDVRHRYHVPIRYSDQLLDGVERDLHQLRYNTFEELTVYCYGVASTVGLMSMHIIGYSPEATSYAIKMGVALQLTNILRDISEDYQAGRLYLPLEDLKAFGLDEDDIACEVVDERWRRMMRFQIARTRQIYAEALPGIAYLNPRGRLSAATAAIFYNGILDDIEEHDYDVFTRRAFVSDWTKFILLLRLNPIIKKYIRGRII
jgi:phytoene synthase